MAKERFFAEVMQELVDTKKTGALLINVVETSEDLLRIYFRNGEIYYISYGSASGTDCIDIIEYYTLRNATFFNELTMQGVEALKFPTKKFISMMRDKQMKVRVP